MTSTLEQILMNKLYQIEDKIDKILENSRKLILIEKEKYEAKVKAVEQLVKDSNSEELKENNAGG